MRQKLLLFISMLMFSFSSISLAEEEPKAAPPLPAFSFGNETVEEQQATPVASEEKKSFFDKVKNFFGFSSEDSEEKDSVNSEAEVVEDEEAAQQLPVEASTQSENILAVEGERELAGGDLQEVESDFPSELPEGEDNRPVANHSIFSSSRAKPEEASELALPEGFEEFAEEQSNGGKTKSASESKDKISGADSVEEVRSEPEIDVVITQNPEQELLLPVQNNDQSVDKKLSKKSDADTQKQPEEKLAKSPTLSENKIEPLISSEKSDRIKVATPNYIPEEGSKSIIDKYKTQLDIRKSTPQQIEQIAEGELVIDNSQIEKFTDETAADIDSETLQFVNNEAQVLLLPDDDVIEGKLTQEAKLNMMDLRSYIQLFWSKYEKAKRAYDSYKLDKFIDDYESERRVDYNSKDVVEALKGAFKAVDSGNIDSLISLLNAYPILHLTGSGGNNLLHEAAYVGNYSAAKFLVLKGINIHAKNAKKQTAMTVAKRAKNSDIVTLLKSAGARKKKYINIK